MPSTTTRFGFRIPLLSEAADGPAGIGNLANDLDARMPRGHMEGIGVLGYEDFRVRQKLAGANMSVDVGLGDANIRLADDSGQRRLRLPALSNSGAVGAPNSPTWTATFTTANGSNPRIDRVVLRQSYTVAGDLTMDVIAGTATAGATLANLTGAAAVPAGVIHLADVLIPTSATTVTDANIQDRRPFGGMCIPPVSAATKLDMVTFEPHPALAMGIQHNTYPLIQHTQHDTKQGAALMWLPRRIVSATRIKWKYIHSTTALAGTYVFAIYDASGRKIIDTGVLTFTGVANNAIELSLTITATTFEAGWYYPFMGLDSSAGAALAIGAAMQGDAVIGPGTAARNVAMFNSSGGTTAPTTIVNAIDLSTQGAGVQGCPVPILTLSVG